MSFLEDDIEKIATMLSISQPGQQPSRLSDWLSKQYNITVAENTTLAESGSGIGEDLYWACFEGLKHVYKQLNGDGKLSPLVSKSLRDELGNFLLWGDGFRDGKLDEALNKSDSLKIDILTILENIARLLIRSEVYQQGVIRLESLLEMVQDVLSASVEADGQSDDDASSDEDPETEGPNIEDVAETGEERGISKFCREVSDNISCMMDFVFVLEQTLQVGDHNFQTLKYSSVFELSDPAHVYVANIREKYQQADLELVQRAGEANWQRHVRIRSMAESMEIPITDAKSIFTPFSMFHDSGLGSSLPAISTYAASNASHTSFASSFSAGKSSASLRVPSTPAEVSSGKPFDCNICGHKQYKIRDRIAWKIHVFADLQPYICTFSTCKDQLSTFPSRKLWADHEFSVHRMTQTWACPFCKIEFPAILTWGDHLLQSHETTFNGPMEHTAIATAERKLEQPIKEQCCPFCLEYPATTRRAFVAHVGRHLEGIALSTLPREDVSDSGSEGSISGPDDKILETPPPLTEAECIQKLTTYASFSIRKVPTSSLEQKASWARAEVTEDRLHQADIKTQIFKLYARGGKTVTERRAALAKFQQGQVTALLDDLASKETDKNFEWSLAQMDLIEKEVPSSRPGKKAIETVVMVLYVKRAPLPGLNPIMMFQATEKNRINSLRPPVL